MLFKLNNFFPSLLLCTFALFLTACSEDEKVADIKTYKAVILQHVETDSFTNMREGFLEGIRAKGYEKNINFEYRSAGGDLEELKRISEEIAAADYDFIIAIATPAVAAIVDLERKAPVFYIGVTDTARGGVAREPNKSKNATGTAMPIPVPEIFHLVEQLTPNLTTFGIVNNTVETSSLDTASRATMYLVGKGLSPIGFTIDKPEDLNEIPEDFIKNVEVLFIPNDTVVEKNISALINTAINAKIPLYCSTNANVYSGCFATISVSTFQVGESTAEMLVEYLTGKEMEEITPRILPAKNILINEKTAKAIGVDNYKKINNVTLIN